MPANLQPQADGPDEAQPRPDDTRCHFPARVLHTGGLRTKLHSLHGNARVFAATSASMRASALSSGASTTLMLARGSTDLEEDVGPTTETAAVDGRDEELEEEEGRELRTSSRVQARAERAAHVEETSRGPP